MNIPLTLTLSMAAALLGSVIKKYYTLREASLSGNFIYNGVGCLTAALILLLWGGFGEASSFTLLLGAVFGIVTVVQGVTNVVALQIGPLSYTSVIISFSMLISALSGVAFFGETLGWVQILGIALILVSFLLSAANDEDQKGATVKWLTMCLVAFLATGGIGVMQKVHQSSAHKAELNAFLVIAFAVSALLSLAVAPFLTRFDRKADKQQLSSNENGSSKGIFGAWLNKNGLFLLALMLISGATVAVNNKFNLYLSGVMDSSVFFPTVNGGGLVLTTLAAVVIFREKLTKKQWVGIAIGILAVLLLCNPF